MADLDDWKIMLALHHHERPWDGLITTDSSILNQPPELAVLIQTKLTLVVAIGAGDNPIKATGPLFAYLGGICGRTDPATPQVWKLRAANRPAHRPWDELKRAAEHQRRTSRTPGDGCRQGLAPIARHLGLNSCAGNSPEDAHFGSGCEVLGD